MSPSFVNVLVSWSANASISVRSLCVLLRCCVRQSLFQIFPHPEVPEMRDYGWKMNTRSSMSLSFVESHVWVGGLSFVSVRFMSSVISFSSVPPEVRVLFPKLSCLLLKSPVSMTLSRPKQNPSMIVLLCS